MIHRAGRSTGCIAVLKDDWRAFKAAFNDAYDRTDRLLIFVEDTDF